MREPAAKDMRIIRKSLHDELVSLVRTLIVEGELPAGSSISEPALCQRFDVSRTPLREALKVLANEGLVELSLNRGATVARLEERDVKEIFPILATLEDLAGNLACSHASQDQIDGIRAMHEAVTAAYRRASRPDYFRLNQDFHDAIIEASGSLVLLNTHRTLSMRVLRARYLANISQQRWSQAVDEHNTIVDALTRRDGPRLAHALREHLQVTAELVLEFLRREQQ